MHTAQKPFREVKRETINLLLRIPGFSETEGLLFVKNKKGMEEGLTQAAVRRLM